MDITIKFAGVGGGGQYIREGSYVLALKQIVYTVGCLLSFA